MQMDHRTGTKILSWIGNFLENNKRQERTFYRVHRYYTLIEGRCVIRYLMPPGRFTWGAQAREPGPKIVQPLQITTTPPSLVE